MILIVDPDAFLAGIFARRFQMARWNVRVAETEADARKILARAAPEAILLDVETVPDAPAFFRELRANPRAAGAALVALARIGDRAAIAAAFDAGADAYLIKGHFVPSEAVSKVERLVAGRASQ